MKSDNIINMSVTLLIFEMSVFVAYLCKKLTQTK